MQVTKSVIPLLVKPTYNVLHLVIACVVLVVVLVTASRRQIQFTADLTLQSPLPTVSLADARLLDDDSAYSQQYDFSVNWFTGNIPVWEKALKPFQDKSGVKYLEIGVYEGRSAIWMLENILSSPSARLTAVDIFEGPYKETFLANIEKSGFASKVTTIEGYSQVVLRELPLDSFHIIYIDGSHSKDDVLEDAVLSWRLLKKGGILIFDDYRWAGIAVYGTSDEPTDFPKPAIDSFAFCFAEHADVIHNDYQLILRKKS